MISEAIQIQAVRISRRHRAEASSSSITTSIHMPAAAAAAPQLDLPQADAHAFLQCCCCLERALLLLLLWVGIEHRDARRLPQLDCGVVSEEALLVLGRQGGLDRCYSRDVRQ